MQFLLHSRHGRLRIRRGGARIAQRCSEFTLRGGATEGSRGSTASRRCAGTAGAARKATRLHGCATCDEQRHAMGRWVARGRVRSSGSPCSSCHLRQSYLRPVIACTVRKLTDFYFSRDCISPCESYVSRIDAWRSLLLCDCSCTHHRDRRIYSFAVVCVRRADVDAQETSDGALRTIVSIACTGALLPARRSHKALLTSC